MSLSVCGSTQRASYKGSNGIATLRFIGTRNDKKEEAQNDKKRRTGNDSLALHCYNDTVLVTIIGLGLIGGSIGLALRQGKKSGWEIVGYSRRQETVANALGLGAIERGETNLKDAVKQAEFVIIATPVLTVKDIFSAIAPHLPSGCVVTDTASTKVQVMKWAEEILPPTVDFIGGHPMAGKETYGIQAAEAELFRGYTYCLTPSEKASPKSIDKVIGMVKKLGAIPFFIDAQEHDNLVAGISHLPMLLSAALVSLTTNNPSWSKMSKLAASGYYDLSRLASGNPEVNAHICLSNREAIVNWIDKFSQELERYRQLVAKEDKRLELALIEANKARQEWLNNLSA
ncbi:MAG TPA: prephenate dehydrogenase/arogenate dehydrogenase family protein [Dehalococcoidia bacterium]